jgi:Fe-S-cluster-containing hydrogenase component 2
MDTHGLPVVDEDKCTACGDCVDICPRELFSLHPIDHRLWVACKNQEKGDEAVAECAVVCTGCGRCAADSPEGLIAMANNLAVIDYSKNRLASQLAIQRCPTGAIVWLRDHAAVEKGKEAKKIIRKSPLPAS